MTATQRTLKYIKDLGLTADIVERFIKPKGTYGFRKDYLNFADIIAFSEADGIIAIQSTVYKELKRHKDKYKNNHYINLWLKSGGKFWIIAWKKVKKSKTDKRKVWMPIIEEYKL